MELQKQTGILIKASTQSSGTFTTQDKRYEPCWSESLSFDGPFYVGLYHTLQSPQNRLSKSSIRSVLSDFMRRHPLILTCVVTSIIVLLSAYSCGSRKDVLVILDLIVIVYLLHGLVWLLLYIISISALDATADAWEALTTRMLSYTTAKSLQWIYEVSIKYLLFSYGFKLFLFHWISTESTKNFDKRSKEISVKYNGIQVVA